MNKEHNLGTRARLELFTKICDAVQHAHQKGVIHRDLKPGNILVTADGQPKILDFGVARTTDGDVQTTTLQTDVGQLIGTLPYMSPEQVGGTAEDLDTRSDVYALGVVLYELLVGRLPYALEKRLIHEAARIIKEEEPTRLSSIDRTLRGDVETIVGHALEKDKTRRYQAASSLAADVRRYLSDEPIAARPASSWYQLKKFSRRNKALVGGVAVAMVLLTAGVLATGLALRRALKAETSLTTQLAETNRLREAEAQQRIRADERAAAAEQAENAEKERADQLKEVSDFQEYMLGQVDSTTAGVRLTEDVTKRLDAALAKGGMPDEERGKHLNAFRQLWRLVNSTDVATDFVDSAILKPAVLAIDKKFKDQEIVAAQLRQVIADRYVAFGLYDAAMPLQEVALETRSRMLGHDHVDALTSINRMGVLLRDSGNCEEARYYMSDCVTRCRRVLGEQHRTTLLFVSEYVVLLRLEGKLDEAELLSQDLLDKRRRFLGEDHPDTAVSIGDMGTLLAMQGKYVEAESYFREAIEKQRRSLGSDHPHTLATITNLGASLELQGNAKDAEPYYREALETSRRVLGEEHIDTIISLSNLGSVLRDLNRPAEAESYAREAATKSRNVLGPEHITSVYAMINFGCILLENDNSAEAMAILSPLESLARKMFKEGDATALATYLTAFRRAQILSGAIQTNLGEIESDLLAAYPLLLKARGSSNKDTLSCAQAIASLYAAWDNADPGHGYDAKASEWSNVAAFFK